MKYFEPLWDGMIKGWPHWNTVNLYIYVARGIIEWDFCGTGKEEFFENFWLYSWKRNWGVILDVFYYHFYVFMNWNIHKKVSDIKWLPLGPTISEFYMSYIKNKIFKTIITKPKIYIHYIDNIFIATHSYDEINKLKKTVLKFTTKLNMNKKNPFPRCTYQLHQ